MYGVRGGISFQLKITIIAVGKIKESFIKKGIDEYVKRLRRFCNIDIIEVGG